MEGDIFTTINVEEIQEIKPHLEYSRPFTLDIKVHMTTHQLAGVILSALEDFGDDSLNEHLKQHGLTIIYKDN